MFILIILLRRRAIERGYIPIRERKAEKYYEPISSTKIIETQK
jgi:hypothetical protein